MFSRNVLFWDYCLNFLYSHIAFLSVLVLLLLTGCGRDNVSDKTKISLNLNPNKTLGTLSAHKIKFIAINVTGPNMQRLTWKWDAQALCGVECGTSPLPPETVELLVPSGLKRYIQVLRVAESDSSNMDFQYGEATTPLTTGAQVVKVQLASHIVSSGGEGSVQGRYLMADGSAYTGKISLRYLPNTSTDAMELFELEMFSGWFSIHAFENIKLQYTLPEINYTLFAESITLGASFFEPTDSVLKVTTPALWQDYNSDGTIDRSEESQTSVLGFWQAGVPATSGKSICYDNSVTTQSGQFIDNLLTNSLRWPSDYTLSLSSNTCGMSNPPVTTTTISISGASIEHGSKEHMAFRGPFMNFLNGSHFNTLHHSHDAGASQLTLQWRYLPEVLVGTKALSGVGVFYNVAISNSEGDDHGPDLRDCVRLKQQGYKLLEVLGGQETIAIPGISTAMLDSTKVVVCPKLANGDFAGTTIETHCLGSGCGGVSSPSAVVVVGTPSPASGDVTASFTFLVNFSNTTAVNLLPSLVSVNGGSCDSPTVTNGTTVNPTVTLQNCSGVGSVGITILAGAATDAANQPTGQSSPSSLASLTNSLCPTNYIPIPALSDYTIANFCVMKYEAKVERDSDSIIHSWGCDNDLDSSTGDGSCSGVTGNWVINLPQPSTPVSVPAGRPWRVIDRAEAILECRSLNSEAGDAAIDSDTNSDGTFDLITNDEWQSIARNIELVAVNWEENKVGSVSSGNGGSDSNQLNQGHSDSVPSEPLVANGDDSQGCDGTGEVCTGGSLGDWSLEKRTHSLSNGEVIWDFGGNLGEWVKDDNSFSYGSTSYHYAITNVSHTIFNSLSGGTTTIARDAKSQLGPSGDYTSVSSASYGGLGYFLDGIAGTVLRGSYWGTGSAAAGIFFSSLQIPTATSMSNIGFRCSYNASGI